MSTQTKPETVDNISTNENATNKMTNYRFNELMSIKPCKRSVLTGEMVKKGPRGETKGAIPP